MNNTKLSTNSSKDKRAVSRHEENERNLRLMILQAPMALTILRGPDYIVEIANQKALELLGRTEKEILNKPAFSSMPELNAQGFRELLDKVRNTGQRYATNELPVQLLRNGVLETLFINFSYEPMTDAEGNVNGIMALGTDVTAQVEARKIAEESVKRYNMMLMQSPFAFLILKGEDLVIQLVNESMIQVLDKGPDVEGKSLLEVLPEIKDQIFPGQLRNVYKTGVPFSANEVPAKLNRNGKMEDCYFNYVYQPYYEADNTISGVTVIAYEVTATVNSKRKIELNEKRFRALVTATSDVVYRMNPDWSIMQELEGRRFLSDTGDPIKNWQQKYIHPKDQERVSKIIGEAIRSKSVFEMEHQVIKEDGNLGWTFSRAIPIMNDAGDIIEWFGAASDITEQKEYEEALKIKQSESDRLKRLYEAVTGSTPDLIYIFDLNYRFIYANDALLKMWGRTFEDAIGRGLLELGYEPWHAAMHEREIDQVIATKESIRGVVSFPHSSLGKRIYDYILVPVIDQNGRVEAIAGTTRDITELKQAEDILKENAKQFNTLANTISNLAWMADGDGWIYWYNNQWYSYTGTTFEEMEGWGWERVHHPDHIERVVDFVKVAWTKNEPWELTFPLRGADGEYRWFLTRAVPIVDDEGKVITWIGTNTDIDEAKSNAEVLEQAVLDRTVALKLANEALEEKNINLEKMNQELESFAYISSHDLQEPLRKIQLFASRLTAQESKNLSVRGLDMFNRIQNAAYRMQVLIQDLLLYSRTSIVDQKLDTINLGHIIDELREEIKEELIQKNATMEVGNSLDINIIPFQFRQLLLNLISNSLKFAHEDRPPHIYITCEYSHRIFEDDQKFPKAKSFIHIQYSDNGIGFDPQHAEQIFNVFQRLHNRDKYGGTGIGLSIVKKIVENHNGTISASGESGKGARFDIYLPV